MACSQPCPWILWVPRASRPFLSTPLGPDGKRQHLYETFIGGKTKAEARWTERQAEIHNKGYTRPTKEIVEEYLNRWIESYTPNLKPTTAENYRRVLRVRILPTIGRIRLPELKPEHLREPYAHLAQNGRADGKDKPLSVRSVRYAHAILHRALKQAVREEKVSRNVADLVDPPRAPKSAARQVLAFTLDQARSIERAAQGRRFEAIYTLAYQTGLRLGELLGLRWTDVDLTAARLHVRQQLVTVDRKPTFDSPKSAKSRRTITLTGEAVDALRRQHARQSKDKLAAGPGYHDLGLVFATRDGNPISQRNVQRDWETACMKASVPSYPVHSLRPAPPLRSSPAIASATDRCPR